MVAEIIDRNVELMFDYYHIFVYLFADVTSKFCDITPDFSYFNPTSSSRY